MRLDTTHRQAIVALLIATCTLAVDGFLHKLRVRGQIPSFLKRAGVKRREPKLFFKKIQLPTVTPARLRENVVLECEAGGSPPPTIHWLYNGTRVLQSSLRLIDEGAEYERTDRNEGLSLLRLSATRSKLNIDCMSPREQGLYTCVAETPTRRIAQSTIVKLEDGEKTERSRNMVEEKCRKLEQGMSARVYMWTAQRLEREGADVQLFCRASGHPSPATLWLDRNGRPIEEGGQYELLDNGDLLVKKISWATNMGVYKCIVENENGRDEGQTFLYPTGL